MHAVVVDGHVVDSSTHHYSRVEREVFDPLDICSGLRNELNVKWHGDGWDELL